ncbi:MAG TPA: response regulator [Planctomycetota bacterium]|nr:response regulator [Planctomycetota bacterium]
MAQTQVVLCIDDDPPVLSAIRRLLRREPYEVLTTEDPEEVLRIVSSREVALIIADQRMPRMLGTDLFKTVRQTSPGTACVILTGHADLSDIAGAMNDGAVDRLIRKPWDDGDFRKLIRQLLDQKKEPSGASVPAADRAKRPERYLRRVACGDRQVSQVLDDISDALQNPRAAQVGVVLVLDGLLRVAGSLNALLLEVVRLIVSRGVRATLVDGSGAAGAFFDLVGGRLPIVVYRNEQELEEPKRILVVEDQSENIEFLRTLIESAGHHCEAVTSVGEAIGRLSSEPFDLVLLDLVLPDAEGIEVARHILERQLNTPVIAISGHLDRWSDDRVARAGIRRQLSKPYRVREILDAIRDS